MVVLDFKIYVGILQRYFHVLLNLLSALCVSFMGPGAGVCRGDQGIDPTSVKLQATGVNL